MTFSLDRSLIQGQGLSQVIEKAETSLGIPSPTELSGQMEKEDDAEGTIPCECVRNLLMFCRQLELETHIY